MILFMLVQERIFLSFLLHLLTFFTAKNKQIEQLHFENEVQLR